MIEEVVLGEDAFDAAARLRKRLELTGRDRWELPAFKGPVLGFPGAEVALGVGWSQGPMIDRVWPLDKLTVRFPVRRPAELGPTWLAVARKLVPVYGPGKEFTEQDIPRSSFRVHPDGLKLPLPAALPAAAVSDIARGVLGLSVHWPRGGKAWLELETVAKPPGVTLTYYLDPN